MDENFQYWHSISVTAALERLYTTQQGLNLEEARKRREQFGKNALPREKPFSNLRLVFNQFKSPFVYILLIAGIIVVLLEDYIDSVVIFGAVAINTFFGFFQEKKASEALFKLKTVVKKTAIVVRNGNKKEINAEFLVPGDIIIIKAGDKVPADARILNSSGLKVNEAALTGEWLAAEKKDVNLSEKTPLADRDNMVYMGTIVEEGTAKAVVVATGVKTELGKIAYLVKETLEERTPFQKKLGRFTKIVGILVGVSATALLIGGMLAGWDFKDIFPTAVAIAVAAIPEGLPIALTVILAIGMKRILKQKGLVRKLLAAETLGSTSVICVDKTGTLTESKMQVSEVVAGKRELLVSYKTVGISEKAIGENHLKALKIGLFCTESIIENPNDDLNKWILRGRPTDKALLMAAMQFGLNKTEIEKENQKLDQLLFDSDRKYNAALYKSADKANTLYVCGAPERILEMSTKISEGSSEIDITVNKMRDLRLKNNELTSRGLRVLGVAYKKTSRNSIKDLMKVGAGKKEPRFENLVFAGFVGLKDPIRKGVKESMEKARQAGIRPIIVTGDHKLTARTVAREIGFNAGEENIIEGKELELLSDDDLKGKAEQIDIYARVSPRHKLRIVNAWQDRGKVVAMTGDGINDAPALKKADIGIALGSGTDVAKEISDLVLLDNNFRTIVKAIEQGRVIFDNIRKVIVYLLADSFSEVILIGGALILGAPYLPVLATQILWVNIISDSFPTFSLAFEPKEKDVMKLPPRGHKTPLLNEEMKFIIFIIGIVTSLILLFFFFYLLKKFEDPKYVQTIIFAALSVDSLFYVFAVKSLRRPIIHINIFSNKYLIASVLIGLLMLVAAIYVPFLQVVLRTVPLSLRDWAVVAGTGMLALFGIELSKWIFASKKQFRQNNIAQTEQ